MPKSLKTPFVFVVTLLVAGWFQFVAYRVLPYELGMQRHLPLDSNAGEYVASEQMGEFHGKMVRSKPVPSPNTQVVLGTQDPAVEKRIEIDLTNQRLYAIEDDQRVAEFPVSTGKWGRTPTGTFKIWIKLRRTTMSGGSQALGTYYYLPNVPYTMFFYNDEIPQHRGYGIHGTYWHSNFGVPMSHGCINMRTRDVEKLYYWAMPETGERNVVHASADNPGTEIVIYGEAPNS